MKKIPAKYELNEDEVKAAIAYWFNAVHGIKLAEGHEIQFRSEQVPYLNNQTKEVFTIIVTQGVSK